MPLWYILGLTVVGVWTGVLWFFAAYYGYVCPAPWFERPTEPLTITVLNMDRRFDGPLVSPTRFTNVVRAETPPGGPPTGPQVALDVQRRVADLKDRESLRWKALNP